MRRKCGQQWGAGSPWDQMALHRKLGQGWERGVGSGGWQGPDSVSSVLLGWLAKPQPPAWWHLVWWCMTQGSVVLS